MGFKCFFNALKASLDNNIKTNKLVTNSTVKGLLSSFFTGEGLIYN
jgi:hypothetical protein